jgi:hypothetical protein
MALHKTKTFPTGVSGEYWIAEPTSHKSNNSTSVAMMLYKDKATRTAGGSPILAMQAGSLAGTYLTGAVIYAWVKRSILAGGVETNFFADAVDC